MWIQWTFEGNVYRGRSWAKIWSETRPGVRWIVVVHTGKRLFPLIIIEDCTWFVPSWHCHWISYERGDFSRDTWSFKQQTVSRVRVVPLIYFFPVKSPSSIQLNGTLKRPSVARSTFSPLAVAEQWRRPVRSPPSVKITLSVGLIFKTWLKLWLSKRNSCAFKVKICVWTSPLHDEFIIIKFSTQFVLIADRICHHVEA